MKTQGLTISAAKSCLQGTPWLSQSFGISADDKPIPLGKYTYYGSFDMPDSDKQFHGATNFRFKNVPDGSPHGTFCHQQCYKLLRKELSYEIKFKDLWPLLMKQTIYDHFTDWSYGGITQYHDQFFDTHSLLSRGDGWMLKDPTINVQNASRILALWEPMCRKLETTRQCCAAVGFDGDCGNPRSIRSNSQCRSVLRGAVVRR